MEETQDLQGFRKPCPRRFRVINVQIGSGWENLTGIFTECFKGYGMDGVVNASVCTGIGEADIISVWAGCKSISCVC